MGTMSRQYPWGTALPHKGIVEAPWGSPTAQDFLSLAAHKYLKTTDASKPKALSGFVSYVEKDRKAAIVDFTILQPGSLIITVECSSLPKLEELWRDYCTKSLNKMVHTYLVTEDILDDLALVDVKLTTTISEEEYRDCRVRVLQNLGEYNNVFNFYTWHIKLWFQLVIYLFAEVVRSLEEGVLLSNRLLGMCRWMGSHFQGWTD